MPDDIRSRINIGTERAENAATSRTRAIAINRNWNFIYFPGGTTDPLQAQMSSDDPQQELNSILGNGRGDNSEAEANAVAYGKAVICNKNINIVVYR